MGRRAWPKACAVNRYIQREGALFSTRNRSSEAVDDESLEQQLFYAVTNPVKDGLVERVAHWKGFSSYHQLATGEVERFTYINRTAWHRAGGKASKKPVGAFTETARVVLSPLPSWAKLTPAQRQAHFRRQVRQIEQHYREERKQEGRGVIGPKRLAKLNPRDRPRNPPKDQGPQPLCHAASKEAADAYKERHWTFLEHYYYASHFWMRGIATAPFPPGSVKAPLIQVAG